MTARRLAARDLALIAVFAALIAALGLVPALQPFPVGSPITAQTLGVMLAGSILGARRGALAVLTFLVLVAAGLPLLPASKVRPQGGPAVFTSISGGFLVGWAAGALVIGWLVERRVSRAVAVQIAIANVIGGIVVIYAIGLPVMAWVGGLSASRTLTIGAGFLLGDAVKVAASTAITLAVLRGYPDVLPRRAAALAVRSGR